MDRTATDEILRLESAPWTETNPLKIPWDPLDPADSIAISAIEKGTRKGTEKSGSQQGLRHFETLEFRSQFREMLFSCIDWHSYVLRLLIAVLVWAFATRLVGIG